MYHTETTLHQITEEELLTAFLPKQNVNELLREYPSLYHILWHASEAQLQGMPGMGREKIKKNSVFAGSSDTSTAGTNGADETYPRIGRCYTFLSILTRPAAGRSLGTATGYKTSHITKTADYHWYRQYVYVSPTGIFSCSRTTTGCCRYCRSQPPFR